MTHITPFDFEFSPGEAPRGNPAILPEAPSRPFPVAFA